MSGTYSLLLVIVAEEAPALGVIGPSFIPVLQKFPGAVDVTRPVRVAWKHTRSRFRDLGDTLIIKNRRTYLV